MSQNYAAAGQSWLLPQSQQEGLDFDYRQVISVVEQACHAVRESGSSNPVKTIIADPGHHSLSYSMVVFACNSGMAVTDAALGCYITDLAPAAGRGERVDLW